MDKQLFRARLIATKPKIAVAQFEETLFKRATLNPRPAWCVANLDNAVLVMAELTEQQFQVLHSVSIN